MFLGSGYEPVAQDVVLLVLLEVDGPLVVTAVALSLVRHLGVVLLLCRMLD